MTARTLKKIVADLCGKRVLVVGDLMLDEYVWGEAHRISPEAPIPVVQVKRRTVAPGGAGNTAANIVHLGGKAFLCGVVGQDREGALLTSVCQTASIDTDGFVVDALRPTTIKTRIVADGQQIVRFDRESRERLPRALENLLLAWCEEIICDVDACILSDYAKGIVTARVAQSLIQLARRHAKPVLVDPKGSDYRKYRGATVIKPNRLELNQLFGHDINDDSSWQSAANQLAAVLPGTSILVTRGAEGMTLLMANGPRHVRAEAREVFDVAGAGDTVIATMALALAASASLEEATELANRAARIVVGKRGTATVSAEELTNTLRSSRTAASRLTRGTKQAALRVCTNGRSTRH